MKLKRIPTEAKDPVEELYEVEEISKDDIELASGDFLKAIRGLSGLSFLNTFTIDEFNKQLLEHFTSSKLSSPKPIEKPSPRTMKA